MGCCSWVPLGVIEVCVGFVVIVDLSIDEISILFRLISLTRTIEEAVPNNLPIQSLKVVAVVLVKVRGEFGVVVLILACSGEARGCFPSSPTLTSRSVAVSGCVTRVSPWCFGLTCVFPFR